MNKLKREIILDIETTGLSFAQGDRIVEIAALEILNDNETGKLFHRFINPCCPVTEGSFLIHGLSNDFLQDKPEFKDIAEDLCSFLCDCKIIAHNAIFDIAFLNAQFQEIDLPSIEFLRVIDSLQLARAKIPGKSHNLDYLAQHFGVLTEKRQKHDAVNDVKILYQIYRKLILDSQPKLMFVDKKTSSQETQSFTYKTQPATPEELAIHQEMLHTLKVDMW